LTQLHHVEPQRILGQPATAAIILVLTVRQGSEDEVRDVLADLSGLVRAVRFRAPESGLICVTGIGAELWDRVYDVPRPAGLHPFRELQGAVHHAPSTPGDLVFHIRAERFDLCFELAQHIGQRLSERADVVDETHGFRYFDERDLLGFVDGTESPVDEAAASVVYVGDEDPAHAGGSYLIVQKYTHDLQTWNSLSVESQELVIGRRKLDDIELSDADKPSNSHVALNTITDADGSQRQIVRENMPFGSVGDGVAGTYFIGYAATPDVIEEMLENMFIGKPEGNYDRILDFSTAITGTLFYIPTADFLDDPTTLSVLTEPGPVDTPHDGSLNIGSLNRTDDHGGN